MPEKATKLKFEFIHPFSDGNGRLGRLWQSLILAQWNPRFADIALETHIDTQQQDYYLALQQSTTQGEASPYDVSSPQ